MLNELKNKSTWKKPNKIIIDHLENIKNSFRNPTNHADNSITYDIDWAQDLLIICVEVINKMMKEMSK